MNDAHDNALDDRAILVRLQYDEAAAEVNRLVALIEAQYDAYDRANDAGEDDEADAIIDRLEELTRELDYAGGVLQSASDRLDGVTP